MEVYYFPLNQPSHPICPHIKFTQEQWDLYLKADTFSEAEQKVRASTYTGRPVGSLEFVKEAESMLGRTLAPKKGGRPLKQMAAGV